MPFDKQYFDENVFDSGSPANIKIKIDNEDVTNRIQWKSFKIKDNIYEEVDSCSFTTIGYKPNISDEIEVTYEGTKIFAGKIAKVENKMIGNKLMQYKVTAKDYTETVNRRTPAETYDSKTINYIIDDLVTEYLSGFTTNNVDCDTELDYIIFDRPTMGEAINELANRVNYNWYIDYDKDIHFFAEGSEQGPKITESNGNLISNSIEVLEDSSQIKNRVFVQGGEYVSDYDRTEYFEGDGSQETFGYANKFDEKPTVTLNGASQDVGLEYIDDDSDYDVMWSFQEKYIRFTSAPADGDTIEASAKIRIPVVVQVENSASISEHGVHEFKIVDKKIKSRTDAKERAERELAAYAQELISLSLQTRNDNYKSGQKVRVEAGGIEGDYIIQRVTREADSPNTLIYSLKLASAKTLGIIRFMQKLLADRENRESKSENVTLQLYYRDEQEIEVNETITKEVEKQDHQSVQVTESIRKDPFVVEWVYAPYFPTSDTDPKRPGEYDRGAEYQ